MTIIMGGIPKITFLHFYVTLLVKYIFLKMYTILNFGIISRVICTNKPLDIQHFF